MRIQPKGGKPFHKLGKTKAALDWERTLGIALEEQMAAMDIEPFHEVKVVPKGIELVPTRQSPFFITVLYRLVTSQADADAPIKQLIDAAVGSTLGINDMWIGDPIGVKRFCEQDGAVSARGNKLMERPYMHALILLEPVKDKEEFNLLSRAREAALLEAVGSDWGLI